MRLILVSTLFSFLFAFPPLDSVQTQSAIPRILHHPPEVIFDNRLTDLELFVDIPQDSIESVSLFLITDAYEKVREIPLQFSRERYTYRFDPTSCACTSLQYFFIVRLIDYSLYSVPSDNDNGPKSIERDLINSAEHFQTQWDANR